MPVNRADAGTVKVPVKTIVPVRMSVNWLPRLTDVKPGPGKAKEPQDSVNGTPTVPCPRSSHPSGAAEKAENIPAVNLRPSLSLPAYPFPVTVTLLAFAGRVVPNRRQRTA